MDKLHFFYLKRLNPALKGKYQQFTVMFKEDLSIAHTLNPYYFFRDYTVRKQHQE
jgi:hypothetical protein